VALVKSKEKENSEQLGRLLSVRERVALVGSNTIEKTGSG